MVELELFIGIRNTFCKNDNGVTEGRMMSSPAIHYNNKVFAFLSRKNKMVFKLGKDYPSDKIDFEIKEFSPFKNKKPLTGWFEVDYGYQNQWEALCAEALEIIKTNN